MEPAAHFAHLVGSFKTSARLGETEELPGRQKGPQEAEATSFQLSVKNPLA